MAGDCACRPVHICRQTCVHHTIGDCMLSYLPSFCNAFPLHSPPAPGGPAARRPRHPYRRRLAGVARLQRSQWPQPRVRLLEPQPSPRCQAAQAHALIPASRHVSVCAAIIVRAPRGVRRACWPPSWSTGCVPTGDRGAYLRETPRVPTGDAPRTYGRRFSMQASTKQSVMRPRL